MDYFHVRKPDKRQSFKPLGLLFGMYDGVKICLVTLFTVYAGFPLAVFSEDISLRFWIGRRTGNLVVSFRMERWVTRPSEARSGWNLLFSLNDGSLDTDGTFGFNLVKLKIRFHECIKK